LLHAVPEIIVAYALNELTLADDILTGFDRDRALLVILWVSKEVHYLDENICVLGTGQ